eukprot:CAMPEP_0201483964 /NCGR_PEP_ID=MMETSP0151_2-20130828/8161_1 /ASSEMBLY_ACC=CAM_ASM_000257 /TAXON_ID=200890 /ORGANISM="Paramoeba atlantica, Strain 621/1 / CCAP 1560/9" /LENGTH=190 /DNA_ID=CAMNT_0047867367 /DNA_START=30 /DNA_END=602 /DNA_ORIENTATION=-
MRSFTLVLLALVAFSCASALSLTGDNFDETLDSGKHVFVKFFAPWCGHCKRMKPDWDQLMADYQDASSVVIAEVDCTEQESLCSDIGVRGYPTIKYWNAGAAKADASDYNGGREFDAMKTFVDENFQPQCSVEETSHCSEKELKFLNVMKAKSAEDVAAQVTRLSGMADKSMTAANRKWINQRLNILKQL